MSGSVLNEDRYVKLPCGCLGGCILNSSNKGPGWTTTPPTEPGWYWMTGTTAGENGEKLAVVKVVTVGPRRVLHVQLDQYLARLADLIELKLVSHWLKLEAPELPKETPS